jgi:hypothetical protein
VSPADHKQPVHQKGAVKSTAKNPNLRRLLNFVGAWELFDAARVLHKERGKKRFAAFGDIRKFGEC